ncbi:hypothetical protein FB567DRAFT_35702 [Paraphoma chrysanthemicola]|uniref:F-box domain-containing protein n=1 Tax=Paraphoma chrysanthemicola TaxID=798071 RepID=A0A8K0RM27_9PLEO|nr:hypothetical protein FB567DRAFT_35702 [Paraphoma chrysanthemicola]
MSVTTENASHTSASRLSNFARFADKIKDSISTKRAPALGRSETPDLDDANRGPHPAHNRRSSSIRYTEKMLQMFSHTNRPGSAALNVNELPVEILQNILIYLDIFDLIRLRRVCKLWRGLIPGESPLLAEALFLKPSYNLHAYSFTLATFDFDFEINVRTPLSDQPNVRSQSTFIDGLSMTRRCLGLIRTSSEIIFHPIIVDFNHYVQGDEYGRSKLAVSSDHDEDADGLNWRNMLVSMPPLTEIRISRTRDRKSKTMCILTASDGVKLGAVFDALEQWGRKRADNSG